MKAEKSPRMTGGCIADLENTTSISENDQVPRKDLFKKEKKYHMCLIILNEILYLTERQFIWEHFNDLYMENKANEEN